MKAIVVVVLLTIAVGATGCHSVRVSQPDRTATEQLLLSTAVDRGMATADLVPLRQKRVYLVEDYFSSYDKAYALGAIRELISTNGAYLVDTPEKAEIIVEARSGGLGIDYRETLFGIPALPIPIPFVGTLETPEVALYKSQLSDSTGKFALLSYDSQSRAHIHSTGSMPGKAYFHYYKILGFINWRHTDIPELDPRFLKRVKEKGK
jgi:hypothetical protein